MTVDTDHLEVTISDDLESITFSAGETSLGVLTEPRLLWECSCHREDGGQSPQNGPCRLHGLPGSSRIGMLFGQKTCLSYRGLRIWWNGHRCWPPSIDSLFLAKTLIKEGWPGRGHRRLWDIGAATGFLGLQLCNAHQWLDELIAVDPDAAACEECTYNCHRNAADVHARTHVLQCGLSDVDEARFQGGDAVVSNPPYLPRAPWQETGPEVASPVAGTEILEGLVHLVARRKIDVALCYSSLAEPEMQAALARATTVHCMRLAEREVPLRIQLDARYVEWLTAERGLAMRTKDVFAYAHEVRVVVLRSPQANSD